jgi:hypothetical protein
MTRAVLLFLSLATLAERQATSARVQPPESVLDRARSYVAAWQAQLSGIVAREHYSQRLQVRFGGTMTRQMESDVLLVHVTNRWVGFRDIAEVDGRPIGGRSERLLDLFVNHPVPDAMLQARRINDEGARYNLGHLYRNFNVPTTALQILETDRSDRVEFRIDGPTRLSGVPAVKIDYREVRPPSLIFDKGTRKYIFTRGKLWIDEPTGRVLATEMLWRLSPSRDQGELDATVTVTYREDRTTGIWVPAEMTEKYDTGEEIIYAHAIYSEIKRFSVVVTDDMTLPQGGDQR